MAKATTQTTSLAAPSAEYVGSLRYDLEARYSDRNRIFSHIEKVRFRQHDVKVPPEFKLINDTIRVPMVDDLLSRVTADMTANQPRFTVPPLGLGDTKLEQSSKVEYFLSAGFNTMDKASRPYRVWPQIMAQAVAFGISTPKIVYRPDMYRSVYRKMKQEPDMDYTLEQLDLGFPFSWLAPDPRNVFLLYEDTKLVEVIEISKRPKHRVQKRYGGSIDEEGAYVGPFDQAFHYQGDTVGADVEFVEHWDSEWVSYFANGQLLKQLRHGYGRVPYFPFFGITTGSIDPALACQSVASRLIGLVEALDRLLTMFFNWAHLGSYPMATWKRPLEGQIPLGPNGKPADPPAWQPGVIQQLNPGEEIGWVPPPPVGPALSEMLKLLYELCKEYGLPPIGKGMGQGDSAGYAINQMLTQIKAIYNPVAANGAASLEDQAAFLLWLIKNKVKHDIPVWGNSDGIRKILKLAPSDIKTYTINVTITPELPQNRIAVAQASLQQQQVGAISMYTHRSEALGIADPEKEDKRVLLEMVKKSPQYMDLLVQKVLELGDLMPKQDNQAAADAFMQGAAGMPQQPPLVGPDGSPQPPMGMGTVPGGPPVPQGMPVPGVGMPADVVGGQVAGLPGQPGPIDYSQPGAVPGTLPSVPPQG